jgi:hypothetical protein
MTFDELLTQVYDLLQRQGRLSYRALKARFQLDDDLLEALKDELVYAQRVAADEDGQRSDMDGRESLYLVIRPSASRSPGTRAPGLHPRAPRREDSNVPQHSRR